MFLLRKHKQASKSEEKDESAEHRKATTTLSDTANGGSKQSNLAAIHTSVLKQELCLFFSLVKSFFLRLSRTDQLPNSFYIFSIWISCPHQRGAYWTTQNL